MHWHPAVLLAYWLCHWYWLIWQPSPHRTAPHSRLPACLPACLHRTARLARAPRPPVRRSACLPVIRTPTALSRRLAPCVLARDAEPCAGPFEIAAAPASDGLSFPLHKVLPHSICARPPTAPVAALLSAIINTIHTHTCKSPTRPCGCPSSARLACQSLSPAISSTSLSRQKKLGVCAPPGPRRGTLPADG